MRWPLLPWQRNASPGADHGAGFVDALAGYLETGLRLSNTGGRF